MTIKKVTKLEQILSDKEFSEFAVRRGIGYKPKAWFEDDPAWWLLSDDDFIQHPFRLDPKHHNGAIVYADVERKRDLLRVRSVQIRKVMNFYSLYQKEASNEKNHPRHDDPPGNLLRALQSQATTAG